MKRVSILFIIILLAISHGYADANQADHWEKVRQMDELAERFKAETGFRGEVGYDLVRMCFGYYQGKFAGIQITAEADTASFRSAFEQILDKVLPYTFAKREQLVRSRITNNHGIIRTEYYQQVNGYRVEGIGRLSIDYEVGRNAFAIGNGTVELPGGVQVNITREDAVNRTVVYHKNKVNPPEHEMVPYTREDLMFCNPDGAGYTLKYIIYLGDLVYYVDSSSGRIDWGNTISDELSTFLIKGKVYNPFDHCIPPAVYSDSLSMRQIEVKVNSVTNYTNDNGEASFSDSTIVSYRVNIKSNNFYITDYSDSLNVYYSDDLVETTPNSNVFTTLIGDSCKVGTTSKLSYAPNTYYHAKDQITQLSNLSSSYNLSNAKIVTNFSFNSPSQAGQTTYIPNMAFRIRTGLHQSIIRHELSHHFTYQVLGSNHFNTSNNQGKAMSESFAHYLSCSTVPTDLVIFPLGQSYLSGSIQNSLPISAWGLGTITEEAYNNYTYGFNIASAWWGLRGNSLFPDGNQGVSGVDTLLVNSLVQVSREIPQNNAYRYKPRYFYNILMSRVDTDNRSWPFNPKQAAIDSVYSIRGFHYYPRVQSVASASVNTPLGRESYNVLDSVYVHISNYPQNTYIQVFVVEDRDYLNVGSAGIAIPAPFEVNGNPVSGIFKTDDNGKWAGSIPFSKQLPPGEYDIIVNNMVNPTTPDNRLHLAFKNDNIIDGVDGLDGPGFTKTGTGDIVVALDLSSSMLIYGNQAWVKK